MVAEITVRLHCSTSKQIRATRGDHKQKSSSTCQIKTLANKFHERADKQYLLTFSLKDSTL